MGTSVVLAGEIGAPYLKLASLRWMTLDRVDTQLWTNQGFYTVDKPQSGSMLVRRDGTFGRSIPDGKQLPALSADEMAYLLDKGKDPVLIVGVGGGREVRAALRQGHHDVRGIEEDVTFARNIMRGSQREWSDGLYDKPEVDVSVGGARNYVRHNKATFQRIFVGYYDTQAASPSGSLAAIPNAVFTTDFVQDTLAALVPEGTLTIMRPDAEVDRVIALVAHALRAQGSRAPGAHMFGCSREKLSTVLVKRTPLQSDELSTLRTHCRRHRFAEILSPDAVKDEARRALMSGLNPAGLPIGQTSDLRPPTEDRPFWFHAVPQGRVVATLRDVRGMVERHRTLLVLAAGAAMAAIVGLLALFVSLALPSRFWGYQSRIPVTRSSMTLGLIAASIVLFGHAFVGRMTPIVGRPDAAVLLFPLAFLLAIGLGAGFARRFDEDDLRAGLQRWLLATTFFFAPLMMGLDAILSVVVDLPLLARIGIPTLIIALVGAGLGAGLGLAVRTASTWGVRASANAIAQAGVMAAIAMLLGTLLSMTWGYAATLLAGAAAMVAAIMFAASARVDVPHAPAVFEPLSAGDTASDDEPVTSDDHESSSRAASV
ncbi:MAG: hypothetical protein IPM54_02890 [Polyangiaceae bacterium]|nr:hypothetical protein [Polyangiaceae bacterium]